MAEVDESNGEEKSEQSAEKESSNTKGALKHFLPHQIGVQKSFHPSNLIFHQSLVSVSYPVGVVSPRTKSPMPVSSTIASYVTLRKAKKPEAKSVSPLHSPNFLLWLALRTIAEATWVYFC